MALSLWKTTQSTFKNQTNDWILVFGTSSPLIPQGNTTANTNKVVLTDASGATYAIFDSQIFDIVAPTGANVTTVTLAAFAMKRVLVIPPGWSINGHGQAYGLSGNLEDLRGYI